MKKIKNVYNDYTYSFEYRLDSKEKIMVEIPKPKAGQKYVKAIYWSVSNSVNILGTMSKKPKSQYALWENLKPDAAVSPMVTALKIQSLVSTYTYVHIWVIME